MSELQSYELRVVRQVNSDAKKGETIRWTVLDGNGYAGCFTDFATEAEAVAWLMGYEQGLFDNR